MGAPPQSPRSGLLSFPPRSTWQGRALRLTAAGVAFAGLVALRVPICPFATLTGHPCPGCGLTRATLALAQGHVHEAIALHPLAPLISPLTVGFVGYCVLVYVRSGRWPGQLGKASVRIAVVGVALWFLLLAVWIARFHGAFGGPVSV